MREVFILDSIPAVIRVLTVFAIILFSIRKKLSLGNAFLLGSVILGIIFGLNPHLIIQSAFFSLIHPKTLSLSIVVCLILILSHSMEASNQMTRLLDGFKGLIKHDGINLILFPALIGLLPMPGGAIFSAPMVKHIGTSKGLSPAHLSFVNYWFRHIWEYWWPLYPGVLLTTSMTGIDIWAFVLFFFPLTIVAFCSGYWLLNINLRKNRVVKIKSNPSNSSAGPFLKELSPILIVIIFGLLGGKLFSFFPGSDPFTISKELGLIFALMLGIGWVWKLNRMSKSQMWSILTKKELIKMFYMVSAILIFKGILEDSHAVSAVSEELIRWKIPLMPITMILPFLVGTVGGISIAFIGTTFPILISLIQASNEGQFLLPYIMLGMASGFAGVLLSPLHLCLLLSNEFFKTSLEPVYRQMLLPCAALVLSSCLYFFLLKYFLI